MNQAPDIVATILQLLKNKNEKAITLLYKHFAPSMYGVIIRIVKHESSAEEVLQDVFLKVWKNADRYDASKGRFYTWLINIARNTSIDFVRSPKFKTQNKSVTLEATVYENEKTRAEEPAKHEAVKLLINSLDEKYRTLLNLVYLQGYTHQELEKELGLPLGTIKTRLRAAILELRNKFDRDTIRKLLFSLLITIIFSLLI